MKHSWRLEEKNDATWNASWKTKKVERKSDATYHASWKTKKEKQMNSNLLAWAYRFENRPTKKSKS